MHLAMIFSRNKNVIHWSARSNEEVMWCIEMATKKGFNSQYRIINIETRNSADFFLEDRDKYIKEIL